MRRSAMGIATLVGEAFRLPQKHNELDSKIINRDGRPVPYIRNDNRERIATGL